MRRHAQIYWVETWETFQKNGSRTACKHFISILSLPNLNAIFIISSWRPRVLFRIGYTVKRATQSLRFYKKNDKIIIFYKMSISKTILPRNKLEIRACHVDPTKAIIYIPILCYTSHNDLACAFFSIILCKNCFFKWVSHEIMIL